MVRVPFDFIARGAVPVACIFGLSRPIPVSGVVFRESHPQSVFMVNEAALNVDRNPFRKLAQSYNNSVYRPLLVCFALFLVIVAISFLIFRYELFHWISLWECNNTTSFQVQWFVVQNVQKLILFSFIQFRACFFFQRHVTQRDIAISEIATLSSVTMSRSKIFV